ncbi:MAG: hypothetical protein HYR70_10545 [Chloroflexi bacterium]|nr:hypothetical protein [Chloroflexota bacterium]MBI3340352.1 hypothetical protein [Chloroflexota bacterium]
MNESTDRPSMPASSSDLELLRRYEPVLRFAKGEQFYPTDVDHYVKDSSLWAHYPDGHDELLVKQDDLTLESLVEQRPAPFGTVHFLRFIEPLSLSESAQVLANQVRLHTILKNNFHAGIGRLARGGLLPRIADALFTISFLLRGRVPAAIAAAAELDYFHMRAQKENFVYYGRVAHQNGWVVLQYWYFYCFNNWRSGFNGVNDHESDWEMVTIYLYEADGQIVPEWAAYASHDFHGDDLRRRWDDADQLELVDGHPVVYAGAGSHASYFRSGEYQAEVNLDLPSWVREAQKAWNKLWVAALGQQPIDPFRIPFVDYARGNGLTIGPGGSKAWTAVLIDESTPWVREYRGLWGLFARDPISGENAPAGPMYNRDGTPRNAWYDPLGFAGLDKVPPPPNALNLLEKNCAEVAARQGQLETLIPDKAGELHALGIKLKGMEGNPHLAKQYSELQKKVAVLSDEVRGLRREYSENTALLQSLNERLKRMRKGLKDDPRAHIRHLASPVKITRMRFDRAAEAWAAVSLSLLLFGFVGLVFLAPAHLGAGLLAITLLFVVTESILRGAFIQTVGQVTALLAVISAVIIIIHFWFWLLIGALLAMAAFLMFQRLRELAGI